MAIKDTKAHFIGIGGIGMSALAELFHQMGATVTGSDLKDGKQTKHLSGLGIDIKIGHDFSNVKLDHDVVVYSSAIDESNPEVMKARELKVPIIPRAEALAEIMRFKRGIAVGGTHGKTTTTSLISSIFLHANLDPTIAVGGRLKLIESTARLGQGPWMVAEADESDGSFSRYKPEISIITNIDSDHLDHFGNFENLQKAFLAFALNVPYYGAVIVNGDDPKTRELFINFTKKIHFYGVNPGNDYILRWAGGHYEVFYKDELLGSLKLKVPGQHNALNALAACLAAREAGVSWEDCFTGANAYSGVDRRFQLIGEKSDIRVFDDYAHHPTEIAATIQACKEMEPQGKLHLIYQPHRYTRTRDCWQDYQKCFDGVENLYLMDIYPAGEKPIEGVTGQDLQKSIGDNAKHFSSEDELVKQVLQSVKPGDVVMTMGAGHVWQLAHKVLEGIKGS